MDLQEHTTCELTESSVDEEAGLIRGVKILGRVSKRGYRYSDQAMAQARDFYEGISLNFDHPDQQTPGVVRPFLDQVGCLQGCEVKITGDDAKDGVYGDMAVLRNHPHTPTLMESAKRFPHNFGLSHNAQGDSSRDGKEVETITQVRSVDIVTRPATNAGLFESEAEETMAKTKTRKVSQILADAPDSKWSKILLEMDPAVIPPGMEVEAPEEADPAMEVKLALEKAASAVLKKLFAGEMDEAAAFAEIKKILGMAEEAGADGEGGGDEAPAAQEAMESLQARLTKSEVKTLLLEANVEALPIRVSALAALPENQRQALLESWPAKAVAKVTKRPNASPGQDLTEAEDDGEFTVAKNADEFMASIRRGA